MNRQRAAQLARYAELAYMDVDDVRGIIVSAKIEIVDNDHSQAMLFDWPDMSVVACRGTQFSEGPFKERLADFKTNVLQGKADWYGSARVHGGYAEAAKDLLPRVGAFVRERKNEGKAVYFTGHSLGGVLATLLASTLIPTATYTFGAPRCGDREFVNTLGWQRLYRIVYESDVAPSYPSAFWGYRHAGQRWHLRRPDRLVQGGGWRDHIHFPIVKGFLDHRVANYVDYLKPRKKRGLP